LRKKTNKDTIENQNKTEPKKTNQNVSRREFGNTIKFKGTASNEEILISLDVNIDYNRVEKLEIYPNDDPVTVVNSFCKKYSLSDEKKNELQKIIEEKLNENIGSNSNR